MAELQKLLEANEAFKSELITDLLRQAQQSTGELHFAGETSSTSFPVVSSPADVNQNVTPATTQPALSLTETSTRDDNLNVLSNIAFTRQANEPNTNLNNNNAIITGTGSEPAQPDSDSPSSIFSAGRIRREDQSSLGVLETGTAGLDISGGNENDRVARLISKLKETPSETKKMLLEQATAAIVEAHLNTTINTHANVLEANENIQQKMKEMPLKPFQAALLFDLYNQRALVLIALVKPGSYALALNSNNLWQHFMVAMLPEITKVIKFSTKLPGFPELGHEDKILLLKQGCFEVMVTRFCLLVDVVKEEMFDPTLQIKAPRYIVRDTPMGEFLDQFFTVASKLNPLALTDEEIGLFTAVLMFCPDREGLMNRATIAAVHQLFLQALYLLLRRNHQDADEILRSLINTMPVVRKINEDHLEFLKALKLSSSTEFEQKFPTLHRELFDVAF